MNQKKKGLVLVCRNSGHLPFAGITKFQPPDGALMLVSHLHHKPQQLHIHDIRYPLFSSSTQQKGPRSFI